jgi:RND family efflux transporter MFP subunit
MQQTFERRYVPEVRDMPAPGSIAARPKRRCASDEDSGVVMETSAPHATPAPFDWETRSMMHLPLPCVRALTAYRRGLLVLFWIGVAWASGCQQKAPQAPSTDLPVIPVSNPVSRVVSEFVDFTGHTEAKEAVSVRPHVSGYLEKIDSPFKEGSEVKAGDVLFKIDPRTYQALVDEAHSQVILNQAQLKLAKLTYERDRSLGATLATSQQQLDQDKANVDAADARLQSSLAALKDAETNLDYTTVKALISGRISRYFYTPGNLVTANQTILTTIVTMDPMYAYFDIDERTYRKYLKMINDARTTTASEKPETQEKSKPDQSDKAKYESAEPAESAGKTNAPAKTSDAYLTAFPVKMALEGDDTSGANAFPWSGTVDFVNNQLNPSTGTITMRGVFHNERPPGGAWRIVPGMFVRVRLFIGQPHPALLVIDRAISSDQGLKSVYVVVTRTDDKGVKHEEIQSRHVVTGSLQEDGLRVIEPYDKDKKTGLLPDDRVVVGGLPQLRSRMEIKPDPIAMPTLANTDAITLQRDRPQPLPPGQKNKK